MPDRSEQASAAIVATRPVKVRRRSGTWRLLVAAAVVAGAAAVAVVAAWHGHGNGPTDRALAALGSGQVLHAVIESEVPNESVVKLSTGAKRPVVPARPYPVETSMRGGNFRLIAPAKAAARLGWEPLRLGASFRSLPLQHTQLQDLIHVRPASPTTHGIIFSYGRGANRIRLTEAKTVEATYWLVGLGIPRPGTALLFFPLVSGPGPIKRSCQALLRAGGIWVQVEGWNEASSLCVDAARSLARIEP